jgi:hypothetical protein
MIISGVGKLWDMNSIGHLPIEINPIKESLFSPISLKQSFYIGS